MIADAVLPIARAANGMCDLVGVRLYFLAEIAPQKNGAGFRC
jgi:hypothetical protein